LIQTSVGGAATMGSRRTKRSGRAAQASSHEMTLILGAVLRRAALAPLPGHEVELQPSVTLRPRSGLRLHVNAR
jgi:hypothetical protein